MQKILVIGESGSGKTTLAKGLSKALNTPLFDIDDYYWLPGWQKRDRDDFREIFEKISFKPTWIISGDSTKTRDIIWPRADTIIWLDYSIVRCLYRAAKRSLILIFRDQTYCAGNKESPFRLLFSKKSIFFEIINSYKKRKEIYHAAFSNRMEGKLYLHFSSPVELEIWFINLRSSNKMQK